MQSHLLPACREKIEDYFAVKGNTTFNVSPTNQYSSLTDTSHLEGSLKVEIAGDVETVKSSQLSTATG